MSNKFLVKIMKLSYSHGPVNKCQTKTSYIKQMCIIVKKGSIFDPLFPRGSERPRSRGADLSGPDGEKLEMVTRLPFRSC